MRDAARVNMEDKGEKNVKQKEHDREREKNEIFKAKAGN